LVRDKLADWYGKMERAQGRAALIAYCEKMEVLDD